jgi:hypothetical protein
VVEFGDTEDHTGALRAVLAGQFVCAWLDDRSNGCFSTAAYGTRHTPTFADALALVRKDLWAQEEIFAGRLQMPRR